MKNNLKQLLALALENGFKAKELSDKDLPNLTIDETKNKKFGDFSTNIAMVLASKEKKAPRQIAQVIINHFNDPSGIVHRMEIAGPGFINFFLKPDSWLTILDEVFEKGEQYGTSNYGNGQKIQVEYVSSNPTGPLHVGHGRGAAVGDAVSAILKYAGFDVQKEYYMNDSGRQIRTLGLSVFLRLKALLGETVEFPEECYQGSYIIDIAKSYLEQHEGEAHLENEEETTQKCARFASNAIGEMMKADLADFGVTFDNWYSEQHLYDTGKVDAVLSTLKNEDKIYEKEGALWFRSESYGDEKDRVVVRQNGLTTYFASDIAYHKDKFDRGFNRVIDVWGADHHGYINRMKAAVEACGQNQDQFEVILVKLVNLMRDGEPIPMSTRAGEFITLKEVVEEVGKDAARFIFLTRSHESSLDFDLELAKKKNNDNPVYYVQYVHARISRILEKAKEKGIEHGKGDSTALKKITDPDDIHMIQLMARYPEVVLNSAKLLEPHRVTYYLRELASAFHTYYNKHRVLGDDLDVTRGRLYLISAVQKVIRNGLTLLGVLAPEKM